MQAFERSRPRASVADPSSPHARPQRAGAALQRERLIV
jgi:hypothetical protein